LLQVERSEADETSTGRSTGDDCGIGGDNDSFAQARLEVVVVEGERQA